MSLSESQVKDIQHTFGLVAQDVDGAAALFYQTLFEKEPGTKLMFKNDMTEQGRKLLQTLSVVVNGLRDLDAIIPAIRALGERHVKYGVTKEQYNIVGESLLSTLAVALGDEWTSEVAQAWTQAYTIFSDTATEGLYE